MNRMQTRAASYAKALKRAELKQQCLSSGVWLIIFSFLLCNKVISSAALSHKLKMLIIKSFKVLMEDRTQNGYPPSIIIWIDFTHTFYKKRDRFYNFWLLEHSPKISFIFK